MMDVSPVFVMFMRGTQSTQTMKDSTEGSNCYANLLWEQLSADISTYLLKIPLRQRARHMES